MNPETNRFEPLTEKPVKVEEDKPLNQSREMARRRRQMERASEKRKQRHVGETD
jgi:hypothetical protein